MGLQGDDVPVRMGLKHGHWNPLDRPAREARFGQGVAPVIFHGRSVACSHVTLYSAHLPKTPRSDVRPRSQRGSLRGLGYFCRWNPISCIELWANGSVLGDVPD